MTDLPTPFDVLDFWWSAGYEQWYAGGEDFDGRCRDAFLPLLEHASGGGLSDWEGTPHGALALLIVLDQLSRNIFRGSPRAFAQDERARGVAERAIAAGFDRAYPAPARNFFHMPFMHSEDLDDQARCCDYFRVLGDKDSYYYALVHLDAIRRFGRFPHRNKVLGRETTAEEQQYLDTGGFAA
ncbi:DUF924 family protein [Microbaculum marinum]|uniref:DUF924 family protein n=1 Tax=Microbaculum marinum TaxID=1764581 RepID=A0AAW9RAH7_9HYPH